MKSKLLLTCLFLSATTFAADPLTLSQHQDHESNHPLINYELSNQAKKLLAERAMTFNFKQSNYHVNGLPDQIDLTMNNTPVLDQGRHGACVTFAVTGAVDAALGKGNYVSQLCNLALGKYLAKNGYRETGWSGARGTTILQQMRDYGIVPISNQKGCGGLKDYPRDNSQETGKEMKPSSFHKKSEPINGMVNWSSVISAIDVYDNDYDLNNSVLDTKLVLAKGHRVTFGTLLDSRIKHAGAVGYYRSETQPDAWMMTPEIIDDLKNGTIRGGHHMIIYGYDDNAIVHDAKGNQQQGVFLVRNSWGAGAGFNGDYVMTYDHFKLMMHEANKIVAR